MGWGAEQSDARPLPLLSVPGTEEDPGLPVLHSRKSLAGLHKLVSWRAAYEIRVRILNFISRSIVKNQFSTGK